MAEENKNKRRGLIATILYHIVLILIFIFAGLTYQDPPPEDGIAINFGYEEDGSGNTSQSAPRQPQPQQEEVQKESAEQIDEDVATQEVEEAPNVTNEQTEKETENEQEEEVKPQPDSRLQNALDKTKNQQGQGEGEGETTGGGDQGDPNGDRNSPNRSRQRGHWQQRRLSPGQPQSTVTAQTRIRLPGRRSGCSKSICQQIGAGYGGYCRRKDSEWPGKYHFFILLVQQGRKCRQTHHLARRCQCA
jgi:type IV secretory pathway VirB10-like protein